jgi:hypothetical protein
VSFVEDEKREERKRLEEQYGATEDSILNTIGKEKGVASYLTEDNELRKKIKVLEASLKENQEALEELGFDFRNGGLRLRWDAPKELQNEVAQRKEEALRPIEKSLKKYDLATARVWTAASGEELQKAVEGLI